MANNQYNFLDYTGLELFCSNLKNRIENNESIVAGDLNNADTRVDRLEDAERNRIISKTYLELKNLKDTNSLVPGQQYRITDYRCTTIQTDTRARDNKFDIIVTADSVNTLNEEARAIRHEGYNTYFDNCDLNAWKIWYSFDNDTNRFSWVDSKNGRGVIYRMIDEHGNDCPYDFKNIQYTGSWGYWAYTFSWVNDNSSSDSKDLSVFNQQNDEGGYSYAYSNVIGPCHDTESIDHGFPLQLNCCVFLNTESFDSGMFYGCHNNTFGIDCYNNTFEDNCYGNTFGNNCTENTFYTSCYNNRFGNDCWYNTFNGQCYENTIGNDYWRNTLGNSCYGNTFGNGCLNNTLGSTCYNNTFGSKCQYNKFGSYCYSNSFGNGCQYIKFASDSSAAYPYDHYSYNHFGDGCQYIVFEGTPAASSRYVQNYHIAQGLQGTSSTYLKVDGYRGRVYGTRAAKNSAGDLMIYCKADLF